MINIEELEIKIICLDNVRRRLSSSAKSIAFLEPVSWVWALMRVNGLKFSDIKKIYLNKNLWIVFIFYWGWMRYKIGA